MKYLIFTFFICTTLVAMDMQKATDITLSMHSLFPTLYNTMHETGSLKDFKKYSTEMNEMPLRDLLRLRTAWLLLKRESKEQRIVKVFSLETVEKLDKIIEEEDEREDQWEITSGICNGSIIRMMQKRTPSPIPINALTPPRAIHCRTPSPLTVTRINNQ